MGGGGGGARGGGSGGGGGGGGGVGGGGVEGNRWGWGRARMDGRRAGKSMLTETIVAGEFEPVTMCECGKNYFVLCKFVMWPYVSMYTGTATNITCSDCFSDDVTA